VVLPGKCGQTRSFLFVILLLKISIPLPWGSHEILVRFVAEIIYEGLGERAGGEGEIITYSDGVPCHNYFISIHSVPLGYRTHLVGKWHLGHYTSASCPTHRGFDSFFGFYNFGHDHYDHTHSGFLDLFRGDEVVRGYSGQYSTYLYAKVI